MKLLASPDAGARDSIGGSTATGGSMSVIIEPLTFTSAWRPFGIASEIAFQAAKCAIQADQFDDLFRLIRENKLGITDVQHVGGPNLLMVATEHGRTAIVKELLNQVRNLSNSIEQPPSQVPESQATTDQYLSQHHHRNHHHHRHHATAKVSSESLLSQFVNYQDDDEWTSLMIAAKENHYDILVELLEADAKVELTDMVNKAQPKNFLSSHH